MPSSCKQVKKIEFVQRKPKFKNVVVPLEDHVQCRCEAVFRPPPRNIRPGPREQRRKDLGISRMKGDVRRGAGEREKRPPLVSFCLAPVNPKGLRWFIPAEGPFPGYLPARKGLKLREKKEGKVRGEGKGMVGKGREQRLWRTEDKEQKNRKRPCGPAVAELFVDSVWRRIFQQEQSAPGCTDTLPSVLAGLSPAFTTAAVSQRRRVRRPPAQKRKHKKYKHVNDKKVLKEILIA